jgi:hypothetical protein
MTSYNYVLKITEPPIGKIRDKFIDFSMTGQNGCYSIGYKIENLTDDNIEIDWNRASLIIDGEAFRIHDGEMKGIDINKEQLTVRIPPHAFKKGVMVSGKNLRFIQNAGWMADCFFKNNLSIGKFITVRVPFLINGKSTDYQLKIQITDIKKVTENILLH